MRTGKILALILVLIVAPTATFWMIDTVRGAGQRITPYLWTALGLSALVAAIPVAVFYWTPRFSKFQSAWMSVFVLWAALAMFFGVAGLAVVGAERRAASDWEASGDPLGDHGSYFEFYPGDSGMAHRPSKITDMPVLGVLTAVLWLPTTTLLMWLPVFMGRFRRPIPSRNQIG
jgi:hypothetical protein